MPQFRDKTALPTYTKIDEFRLWLIMMRYAITLTVMPRGLV